MAIYAAGIAVTNVTMQPAKAPEEVKSAFDDAIKAKEDEQRFINQAQAYLRGAVPIAEGRAKRITQEAEAYRQEVILQAKGNTSRFLSLLPEYQRAPKVTRERMYLDAMESVLTHTSKLFIDVKDSNNMFYLPLDKIVRGAQTQAEPGQASQSSQTAASRPPYRTSSSRGRSSYQGRGVY